MKSSAVTWALVESTSLLLSSPATIYLYLPLFSFLLLPSLSTSLYSQGRSSSDTVECETCHWSFAELEGPLLSELGAFSLFKEKAAWKQEVNVDGASEGLMKVMK